MMNRQIGILFLVGILIAVAGFLVAAYVPFPARMTTDGAFGLGLRALLAISTAVILISQMFVTMSALRVPVSGPDGAKVRTTKSLEFLWSLSSIVFVVLAVLYAL